jgi:hypothetical protein
MQNIFVIGQLWAEWRYETQNQKLSVWPLVKLLKIIIFLKFITSVWQRIQ